MWLPDNVWCPSTASRSGQGFGLCLRSLLPRCKKFPLWVADQSHGNSWKRKRQVASEERALLEMPTGLTDIHVSLNHGATGGFGLAGTIKLISFQPLPWAGAPSIKILSSRNASLGWIKVVGVLPVPLLSCFPRARGWLGWLY